MHFIKKEPIEKGWSGDKKYAVTAEDGTKYLLRISPVERRAHREAAFRMQQEAAALGIPMCRPLACGVSDAGVYILQSFIEGDDAEEVIPHLPEDAQYRYGLDAGRILRRLHTIPAPADLPAWDIRFSAKMERKIRMYAECPVHFDGAEHILAYLQENAHLLTGRPQCFQHGDYHIGNMMLEQERLVIIDFDRCDFGDPWEEFNRIVWCAPKAPVFARGMVDGYFDGTVPAEFWRLLALYIGSNMLSSIPWAIPFGQGEIDTMLHQAEDVLYWYDNMKNPVPIWYTDGQK